ncbi:hypothetical protein PVAR5_7533 [Paecilomyces variotii No. 5]|uniref:Uncharacterized protein n=1 Tax=Byssochlamys spectabilis (strain No. 5 / NBRC 109023) TaxID=1356009 RepID=V5G9Y2_BYSSN|nr:hypothetical protein PVAR5_7533 [Paecilomyces variotii No. 5]
MRSQDNATAKLNSGPADSLRIHGRSSSRIHFTVDRISTPFEADEPAIHIGWILAVTWSGNPEPPPRVSQPDVVCFDRTYPDAYQQSGLGQLKAGGNDESEQDSRDSQLVPGEPWDQRLRCRGGHPDRRVGKRTVRAPESNAGPCILAKSQAPERLSYRKS